MKRRALVLLLVCLIAVAFIWGVLEIFDMRFARGDIYPPYSSLRADPLGTRVLYQSLGRLSNINTARNQDSAREFALPPDSASFYIGTSGLVVTEKELLDLEAFIKKGGRFVLTFYPQGRSSSLATLTDSSPTPTPTPSPTAKDAEDKVALPKVFVLRDIAKRWEFGIQIDKEHEPKDASARISGVEAALPWHSSAAFDKLGSAWRTIYAVADRPVVIERRLGSGTIVLATDSYFLSNEAMRRDRRPSFLACLVGDKPRVVFDEVHHGISEVAGVSTLIRRYRLGGFVIAALITAILATWKNVVRLVPASAMPSEGEEFVSGKESFAGLTSLFRRNIAPSELAEVCYAEWSGSLPRASRSVQLTADRVRVAMEEVRNENRTQRDPVEVYRRISGIISNTKWKRSN